MTPAVWDRCAGEVKAVEVGQSFESRGTPCSACTCSADPSDLTVRAVCKKTKTFAQMSSMRLKIEACSAVSFCPCVAVAVHLCSGSLSGSKGDRQREVTCAQPLLSHFPVCPLGTNVVLLTYQTPFVTTAVSLLFAVFCGAERFSGK